jgi:hypothetical protein
VRWSQPGALAYSLDVTDEETRVYALNLFDIADREESRSFTESRPGSGSWI